MRDAFAESTRICHPLLRSFQQLNQGCWPIRQQGPVVRNELLSNSPQSHFPRLVYIIRLSRVLSVCISKSGLQLMAS